MNRQNTSALNAWLLVALLLSLQAGCYALQDRRWYETDWPERIAVFYDNAVRVFKLHPGRLPLAPSAEQPGNGSGEVVANRHDYHTD